MFSNDIPVHKQTFLMSLFPGLLSGEMPPNFSGHTLDKATKAKVTLENYYSNLISQHRERKHR